MRSELKGRWINPADGREMSHQAVMRMAAGASALLLGEQHDKAAQHRWQLHVSAGVLALEENVVMGFEMFPARLDEVLAAWTKGELSEEAFLEQSEWKTVWGFPAELYLPLFRFCRQFGLSMHGLNCRRALVSEVGKLGWDAIAVDDRDGVTPALEATSAYRRYLFDLTGGGVKKRRASSAEDPAFDRFVRAQQVWDRAFACRIAALRGKENAPLVIGIIGRGHLEFGHGTPAQLADLGVGVDERPVVTLLPHVGEEPPAPGVADAVFKLDPAEV